jgi:hypothetical protein
MRTKKDVKFSRGYPFKYAKRAVKRFGRARKVPQQKKRCWIFI